MLLGYSPVPGVSSERPTCAVASGTEIVSETGKTRAGIEADEVAFAVDGSSFTFTIGTRLAADAVALGTERVVERITMGLFAAALAVESGEMKLSMRVRGLLPG